MQACQIISDEHQSLAGVLHAIRFMLRQVAGGQLEPDLALFRAMVHYLEAYAEQRHHPKEDLLFQRLARRSGEGGAALAELAAQHAAAPRRIAALQQALAAFVADGARFGQFSRAFDDYAEFYRSHMLLEENVVLPLIRRHLTAADWVELDAAFRDAATAGRDGKSEDFSALFSRLVDCAPAPLGFGPRPYQDQPAVPAPSSPL